MQLQRPGPPPAATDVPTALRTAAGQFGHRPAISVLTPDGRQEQSYAGLLQWASKTAHWLDLDLFVAAGQRVAVLGPVGWVSAAAALGAWWAGVEVTTDPTVEAAAAIVHESRLDDVTGVRDVVTWGWAFDGTPTGATTVAPFTHVVQPFPDDPPFPVGAADAIGLDGLTQATLLERFGGATSLGVSADHPEATAALAAVALRPLTSGKPTVVLAGTDHAAADGDRVGEWLA